VFENYAICIGDARNNLQPEHPDPGILNELVNRIPDSPARAALFKHSFSPSVQTSVVLGYLILKKICDLLQGQGLCRSSKRLPVIRKK